MTGPSRWPSADVHKAPALPEQPMPPMITFDLIKAYFRLILNDIYTKIAASFGFVDTGWGDDPLDYLSDVWDAILGGGGGGMPGYPAWDELEALLKEKLGKFDPLNALNLFNIVPRYNMGFIPFSHIGDGQPNLLANPTFQGAESVQGSGIWVWDDVEGHTKPGCVRTTAVGVRRHLLSNAIPCSPDQKFDLSVWVKWSGLTYTGPPIKLQVVRLLSFTHVAIDDVTVIATPAGAQGWTKYGGTYTVPAGTDMISFQLAVTAEATGGTVWFDDGDVHKTGLLQMEWVDGLTAALTQIWEDLQKAVDDILALFGLTGDLGTDIQNLIDKIFQTFTQSGEIQNTLEEMAEALKRIPNIFVGGVGGPANIGDSLQASWDLLMSGFVGTQGGTGAGLADWFNVGFDVSSWASKGRMSFDILGIRNNKSLDQGLLPTSLSNFGLSQVAMQASAPVTRLTRLKSAMAFIRVEESNNKGVVQFLGGATSGAGAIFVNIWKMNQLNGDLTMVMGSNNLISQLPGAGGQPVWVLADFASPIPVVAGEVYGIEIVVNAASDTAYHDVVSTTSWLPSNNRVFPKGLAATRNTVSAFTPPVGTVIPGGSVAYSGTIPWVEWGIASAVSPDYHPPETHLFNSPRTGIIPIPAWANFIDVVALGSGAGGGGGGFAGVAQHNGGGAGTWGTATWVRGTDFTTDGIDATVRAGGNGAPTGGTPTAGGVTSARLTVSGRTVNGNGGAINWGQDNGQGAGHIGWNGVMYQGGGQQGVNGGAGAVPGSGGASGPDLIGGNGGPGAPGSLWLTFRQS